MTTVRRIMRRGAAVGVGCTAIAAMSVLLGAPAAAHTGVATTSTSTLGAKPAANPAADPAPLAVDLRADVSIHEVTPTSITPGGTVTLAGTVTNTGSETLEGPQALLRYSPMGLDSRSQIDQVYSDPTFRLGSRPGPPYFEKLGDELAPGVSAPFSLEVAVDDLELGDAGIYIIGIEVLADDTSANAITNRTAVGSSRTVVPYLTDDQPLPEVPLATVWNLDSEPRISADRSLVNDELAAEIGTDGRLGRVLRAGADTPVTWLIDPDLLLTVDAMGTDYTVGAGDDAVPGTGGFAASGFWEALDVARDGSQTLVEPLADPDIESFVATEPHLADRLITTAVSGTGDVVRRLAENEFAPESSGPDPDSPASTDEAEVDDAQSDDAADHAAPTQTYGPVVSLAGSALTPDAADAYSNAGVQQVILNPDSVESNPSTPFATVPTESGPLDAIISDRGLDAALVEASGTADPQGTATRVAQRWRAETAMIALEAHRDGTTPDGVVAVPPADWNPSSAALEAVVNAWTNTPWITAGTISEIDRPDRIPEVDLTDATSVGVLPIANVAATEALETTAQHFLTMLADPAAAEEGPYEALDLAVVRSASRSWRSDPSAGLDYSTTVLDQLTSDIEQVTLSVPEQVTLSSSTGVFPLTVDNPLDYPVSVRIAVSSANPDRLRVDAVTEHTVQEGTRTTVNVEAEAFSNGRVPVRVGLVATDGTDLGPQQRTVVNATDYGAFGWVVVAAGALMLAWSVGRRVWRRRHPNDDADSVLADMEVGLDPVAPDHPDTDDRGSGRHSKGSTSRQAHTGEGVTR